MMDRHLDQLLMCAVYVMAKVTKEDKSFQNIMKCYRTQPQASSHVSTDCHSGGKGCMNIAHSRELQGSSDKQTHKNRTSYKQNTMRTHPVSVRSSSTLPAPQPGSAPSTPTNTSNKASSSSSSSVGGDEEERGDLIHFYNNVYIKQMRHFALRYSPSSASAGVREVHSPTVGLTILSAPSLVSCHRNKACEEVGYVHVRGRG
uniref:Retinoblastoma-associated protein B-box domain-containing protein n=1 Tax=Monopterus albus TaxID=43700 RepID=A0A3Q3JL94_MONAL